jgi:hypothetical protein
MLTLLYIKGLKPLFQEMWLILWMLREGKYRNFTSALEADLERDKLVK